MSTSSSISCREDFCPSSLCFPGRALPTGWSGLEVLRALIFSLVPSCLLGTAVFLTSPALEASWHFLEVPRRTPEPEPCPGRTGSEQMSVVLSDSQHLCERKKRAGKSPASPVLLRLPCCQLELSCPGSVSISLMDFPVYLPFPHTCSVRSHYKALLLNSHLLCRTFFVFPRAALFPLIQGTNKLSSPTNICLGHFSSFPWAV